MAASDQKQNWRARLGWLAGQLLVIFLGVTTAFIVENYREGLSQREELHQAIAGLITELERYETRSVQYADAFDSTIEKWKAADRQRTTRGAGLLPDSWRVTSANLSLDYNC